MPTELIIHWYICDFIIFVFSFFPSSLFGGDKLKGTFAMLIDKLLVVMSGSCCPRKHLSHRCMHMLCVKCDCMCVVN